MIQQTIDDLRACGCHGMIQAYVDQQNNSAVKSLGFEERFASIVAREKTEKETKRIQRLLGQAKLKEPSACIEDITYQTARSLDRSVIANHSTCDWVSKGWNMLITGATGTGKTWLGCAMGNQAARRGFKVLYYRSSRLLEDLVIASADGSLPKLRTKIRKTDLLIIDDWALSPITAQGRHELLEVIDDRIGERSILITSQLPVSQWHEYLGEPTIADAILDRLVHRAHRLELEGPSLRKVDEDKPSQG